MVPGLRITSLASNHSSPQHPHLRADAGAQGTIRTLDRHGELVSVPGPKANSEGVRYGADSV